MKKSVRKFFWLFFTSQEQWLNQMSDEGWRLVGTSISGYEFEECEKGKYRYKVAYIANRSKESAEEYVKALEACGYRVLYKNANLNYSTGKVEYRPWAEEGGRVATEKTTLHKELLIIEKENNETEFSLCATSEQRYESYNRLRLWGIIGLVLALVLAIVGKSIVWGIVAFLPLVWTVLFHMEIGKLK
ncbi:MAG: DUF2812 domain-containing protein [Lachnospiraceae bacterium]|nr:DUF2812 domain-containing protein [Lachnospiraceae bacterium]